MFSLLHYCKLEKMLSRKLQKQKMKRNNDNETDENSFSGSNTKRALNVCIVEKRPISLLAKNNSLWKSFTNKLLLDFLFIYFWETFQYQKKNKTKKSKLLVWQHKNPSNIIIPTRSTPMPLWYIYDLDYLLSFQTLVKMTSQSN